MSYGSLQQARAHAYAYAHARVRYASSFIVKIFMYSSSRSQHLHRWHRCHRDLIATDLYAHRQTVTIEMIQTFASFASHEFFMRTKYVQEHVIFKEAISTLGICD